MHSANRVACWQKLSNKLLAGYAENTQESFAEYVIEQNLVKTSPLLSISKYTLLIVCLQVANIFPDNVIE